MNNHCLPISSFTKFNINIIIHVLILFTFLTVFYFFYASKLIKDSFDNELKHLIESNINNLYDKYDISPSQIALSSKFIDIDKFIKIYQQPDTYVSEHNKWVERSAYYMIFGGLFILITIIVILYFNCNQCTPIWDILLENIIVFTFVGIFEYMFFVKVAFKYVPAPPSLLVNSLLNKFKSSLVQYS